MRGFLIFCAVVGGLFVLALGVAIVFPEHKCIREAPENPMCGVETVCVESSGRYCERYRDACRVMHCVERAP